jgi:signal transduction histidine kinase
MRRIRLVFAALALLLLVPMGLLVQRALESVELEREVSHRAVAERLLDEMERELSRLLRSEEERPFDDSQFGAAAGAKSDVAAMAERPAYVEGYFQIDPDGSFRSPTSPRQAERPAAPGEPAAPVGRAKAADDRVGEFAALVRKNLRAVGDVRDRAGSGVSEGDGAALRGAFDEREVFFEALKERADQAEAKPAAESEPKQQVSPYEALQSLNKGALARSERQVKRAPARSVEVGRLEPERPEPADLDRRRLESGPGEERSAAVPYAAAPQPTASPPSRFLAATATDAESAQELAEVSPDLDAAASGRRSIDAATIFEAVAPADGAVAVQATAVQPMEVHPMTGRLIDAERLLLVRSVYIGERRYRQGLVVNLPALFRRLDFAAVAGSGLERFVESEFFTAAAPLPERAGGGAHRSLHRFAEPFDALGVRLTLQPLPDVAGAGYLYAIAALLLLSGTVGLLALYRMVAVTVRFAERRSNFVAAVSHELKTPLTAIRMYAEMLRDGMVDDEDKRKSYYATITAESERLTRLINNVLEYSRLEQGKRETRLVVGAVGPVVRDAVAILEPHARESGFRLDVEVEADLPPVRFDRDAVLQVVFNLVDNALKYARDAGDRVIAIRCLRDGDGVRLVVRDRGPGVAARHLTKIFEPFYRCEDELTRTAKGTGIGLALVRGLAETMGAAVSGYNVAEGGFEVALRFSRVPKLGSPAV